MLVITLRAGDRLMINGAMIRFRAATKIELTDHPRFLFGNQVMAPEEACTPARRIYFALQMAYVGTEELREAGLRDARHRIAYFQEGMTFQEIRDVLDQALVWLERGDFYQALICARAIIQWEDRALEVG